MADWKKNSLHDLHIDSYTAQGFGVARLEGRVVFIPGTIRGEDWTVQLLKVQKNIAWAGESSCSAPSPARVEPDCPISGKCGGCQYRHMTYEEELSAKWDRVNDALRRLGGLNLELPPVLGAEDPLRYRNKVQLPVAQGKNGLSIGYFRPRSHDVLDVADCPLQPLAVTRLREAFKAWMEQWSVPAYDEGTCQGLIRHLYVRTNQAGQTLCCVVANGKKLPQVPELVDALRAAEPGLIGLVLNVNQADTNVILGPEYRTLWGQDFLEETLCGMTFRLSVPPSSRSTGPRPSGFTPRRWTSPPSPGRRPCWTCTAASAPSPCAWPAGPGMSSGRRWSPEAIEDARANALRNGVTNAEFFCGDAGVGGGPAWPARACVPRSSAWTRPAKGLAPAGAGGAGLHGAGPHRLRLLRPGHPGPGCETAGGAGLPGRPGPAGGSVSQDRPCGDGAADGTKESLTLVGEDKHEALF